MKISEKCQISRSQKPSQIKKRYAGKNICHFLHLEQFLKEFAANFYAGENSGGTLKIPYFGHFWPFLAKNGQFKVPSRDQITPPNNFSYQKNIVEDSQAPKYIGKIFFGRTWSDPERLDLLSIINLT